jgi:hypothetical protein
LIEIFRQKEVVVMTKLEQQAVNRGPHLAATSRYISATVSEFVAVISAAISRKVEPIPLKPAFSPL